MSKTTTITITTTPTTTTTTTTTQNWSKKKTASRQSLPRSRDNASRWKIIYNYCELFRMMYSLFFTPYLSWVRLLIGFIATPGMELVTFVRSVYLDVNLMDFLAIFGITKQVTLWLIAFFIRLLSEGSFSQTRKFYRDKWDPPKRSWSYAKSLICIRWVGNALTLIVRPIGPGNSTFLGQTFKISVLIF